MKRLQGGLTCLILIQQSLLNMPPALAENPINFEFDPPVTLTEPTVKHYDLAEPPPTTKASETLVSGSRAGQELGAKGFLMRLVATPDAPLRAAILPPLALDGGELPAELAAGLQAALAQQMPDWTWQVTTQPLSRPTAVPSPAPSPLPSGGSAETDDIGDLEQPSSPPRPTVPPNPEELLPGNNDGNPDIKISPAPSPSSSLEQDPRQNQIESEAAQIPEDPRTALPFNLQIMQLADSQGLDLALGLRIQKVADGYWVLYSLYSGADGAVLLNRKLTVTSLEPVALATALQKALSQLPESAPVNDIGPAGSELHLRTTPPGLHAYLDEVPVGLSPLILRQLPPGQHQLRLFEAEPYQVERIRVTSDPPGLKVVVNDRELGRTPLDFPAELMLPGAYEIELSSEGRDRYEAEIQVQTSPEGVPVQLDKLPVKRTPVTFRELDKRSYVLHLLPHQAIDVQLPIELGAAGIEPMQVDVYKFAKLIVNSSVLNAELSIDNEVVGETPYSANLAQGLHSLRLSKNRFRTHDQAIELVAGQTHELFFELRPRSADTSIFLTPTGELTPQLNFGAKYLTFGQLQRGTSSELGHLYGLEVDYGWPDLWRVADAFDLGLELSGFFFALQTPSIWRNFQGLGSKLQFLRESDVIPISAALGAYVNIDPTRPKLVGYLSLSRNFGDFALHLGIQTHGFNLNAGYTGWENIRLGLLIYADSFLRLLADENESVTTFFGVQAGYSF